MSEATKLAEYLGFEVVYLDGFAYIQEEGINGPEIRDATLEERTLWTELEHVSAELAALKAAMGEPVGFMNAGHIHELRQKRIPYGYVYQKEGTGAEIPLYTIPLYTLKGIK